MEDSNGAGALLCGVKETDFGLRNWFCRETIMANGVSRQNMLPLCQAIVRVLIEATRIFTPALWR